MIGADSVAIVRLSTNYPLFISQSFDTLEIPIYQEVFSNGRGTNHVSLLYLGYE